MSFTYMVYNDSKKLKSCGGEGEGGVWEGRRGESEEHETYEIHKLFSK